jgi:YidC/Oxa1 family membrane protein insertase
MDGWMDGLIDSVTQARYKEDPQKQNEMIAQLYKDEEVNPLAGCIPTLIQLPIFISLYRGLLELAQADKLQESFLWIPSLEGPVGEYNPVTNLPVDSLGWLTKNWVDGCVAAPASLSMSWTTLAPLLATCSRFLARRRHVQRKLESCSFCEKESWSKDVEDLVDRCLGVCSGCSGCGAPSRRRSHS